MSAKPRYRLRPAEAADAAGVSEIYAPIVRNTIISFELEAPDAEAMATRIKAAQQSHAWLVAVDAADVVCAYAYASAHRARPAYQWSSEVSVYVGAQHRRRGLALALYTALEDCLHAQGYRNAFAGVALPNPGSCAFHRRCGYRSIGIFADVGYKNGRWISTAWFSKTLNSGVTPTTPEAPLGLNKLRAGGALTDKLLDRGQALLDESRNES